MMRYCYSVIKPFPTTFHVKKHGLKKIFWKMTCQISARPEAVKSLKDDLVVGKSSYACVRTCGISVFNHMHDLLARSLLIITLAHAVHEFDKYIQSALSFNYV